MSQHQAGLSRGCPAVLAFHDLDVCPTHADRHRFHKDRAIPQVRLGNFFVAGSPRCQRFYCNCFHDKISFIVYFSI